MEQEDDKIYNEREQKGTGQETFNLPFFSTRTDESVQEAKQTGRKEITGLRQHPVTQINLCCTL
jgi:hypothetical protein